MNKNTFSSDNYLDGYIVGCIVGVLAVWVSIIALILTGTIWKVFIR